MADAVNRPAYWLSDGPVTATLWTRLHADHGRSGLWPLLPEGLDDEPARPWLVGEVDPEPVSDIDEHDPAGFFAKRWAANVAPPNDEWLQEFQEESGVDYFDQVSPQAAVVPSWEDRFGVRLVGIAFETLELSVAAPPVTFEHALHVAAEH